jgi:hypothetical protein
MCHVRNWIGYATEDALAQKMQGPHTACFYCKWLRWCAVSATTPAASAAAAAAAAGHQAAAGAGAATCVGVVGVQTCMVLPMFPKPQNKHHWRGHNASGCWQCTPWHGSSTASQSITICAEHQIKHRSTLSPPAKCRTAILNLRQCTVHTGARGCAWQPWLTDTAGASWQTSCLAAAPPTQPRSSRSSPGSCNHPVARSALHPTEPGYSNPW